MARLESADSCGKVDAVSVRTTAGEQEAKARPSDCPLSTCRKRQRRDESERILENVSRAALLRLVEEARPADSLLFFVVTVRP